MYGSYFSKNKFFKYIIHTNKLKKISKRISISLFEDKKGLNEYLNPLIILLS